MEIRKGTPADLDEILQVIDAARAFMRAHGNMNQWINGYPSREIYAEDMAGGHCYVIMEDGRIHGVFSLFDGEDPTYSVIEDGQWLNDKPYVCIHRIGSDGMLRGMLKAAVDFAGVYSDEIRADTHADNYVMQKALQKCGFVRCGVIHIADGSPRTAFHRSANHNAQVR